MVAEASSTCASTENNAAAQDGLKPDLFAGRKYPEDSKEQTFASIVRSCSQLQQRGEEEATSSSSLSSPSRAASRASHHTICFGLLFKSWKMELAFLDKQAEAYKYAPYVAYALLVVSLVLEAIHNVFSYAYFQRVCPVEESDHICTNITISEHRLNYVNDRHLSVDDYLWVVLRNKACAIFTTLGMLIIGASLQYMIHRLKRIKHKAWSYLVLFLVFIIGAYCIVLGNMLGLFQKEGFHQAHFFLLVMFATNLCLWVFVVPVYYGANLIQPVKIMNAQVDTPKMSWNAIKDSQSFFLYGFFLPVCAMISVGLIASFDFTGREMYLKSQLANKQANEIIEQKTINEGLQRAMLEKMLPSTVVDQMQKGDFSKDSLSKRHLGVSVMFCDIVGFTRFSSQVDPSTVMSFLNELFTSFDQLCETFSVYKVETVGDCYVAAVGVVTGVITTHNLGESRGSGYQKLIEEEERQGAVQNTLCMVRFARAILEDTRKMTLPGLENQYLELRVGIHTGECMSGIVGTRNLRFCLFGDLINVSARMKQKGFAGCIHATEVVADLASEFEWEKLEKVMVKGKGLMQTYLLKPQSQSTTSEGFCTTESRERMLSLRIDTFGSERSNEVRARRDMGGIHRSLSQESVEDAFVEEHSYGKYLRCFGLCFHPLWVERTYLDHHARLHKNVTYVAYVLSCISCVGPFLFQSLTQWSEVQICSLPENENVCVDVFAGKIPLEVAQSKQYMLGSFFLYNYRVYFCWLYISFLFINGSGCAVHYLIHKLKCIRDKSWATLSTFVFFAIQIAILTFVIHQRLVERDNDRWIKEVFHTDNSSEVNHSSHESWNDIGYYLFVSYILVFTAYSCVMASLFQANLLLWIFGLICYFTELFKVVDIQTKAMRGNVSEIADNAIWDIFQNLFFLSCIAATYLMGSYCFTVSRRKVFLQRVLMRLQANEIIEQKTINEGLQRAMLEKMLPSTVVDQMQKGDFSKDSLSKRYHGVSVMFCDIVGFTRFSSQVDPSTVMSFLNELFTSFDQLCETFSVYKVETVGDCYVAAVGVVTGVITTHNLGESRGSGYEKLFESGEWQAAVQNTLCMVRFARAILEDTRKMTLPGLENQYLELRVGIHTGDCISGIMGKTSMRFSLFGEAVDGAQEMEESGLPGFIHVSSQVASLLPEQMWRCAFESKNANGSGDEKKTRTTTYLISL